MTYLTRLLTRQNLTNQPMRIAHISDSHLSDAHPQRANNLDACIEVINADAHTPDAVIHTGDVSQDGLPQEYLAAKTLLNKLKAPYFVMPGNRDKRKELINAFADDKYIDKNDEYIQYCVDEFPVRMIILDTLSESTNKGQFDEKRRSHLEHMLETNGSKPTAIFMHHTPFRVDAIPDPLQFANWDDVDLLAKVLDQHDQVVGIYCGHIHRSINGVLGKHAVQAISCMASDLRKGQMSDAERRRPMLQFHQLAST